jgi:hypothetical protein
MWPVNNQCHKLYRHKEQTYTSNENVESTLAIHFILKAICYAKMKFPFKKAIMIYKASPPPQHIKTDTHTYTYTYPRLMTLREYHIHKQQLS